MRNEDMRKQRGRAILQEGNQIRRLNTNMYLVKSQSHDRSYLVVQHDSNWSCECPDHKYRNVICKHIWATRLSLALRKEVSSHVVIEPLNVQSCPYCQSSEIVKRGVRHNKHGGIQRFSCKACGSWFVINLGFKKMKATPQVITSAM